MLFPQATMERARRGPRDARLECAGRGKSAPAPTWPAIRSFWSLEDDAARRPARCPDRDEIILNRTLADELHARVGDSVTLRLPKAEDIPADSPLGEKTDRIRSFPRLKVIEIIPAAGLGQFSLTPSQTLPSNAYVSLEQLQDGLEQPGRINSILVAGQICASQCRSRGAAQALAVRTAPDARRSGPGADAIAAAIHSDPESEQAEQIYDYFSLSSQRMILPPEVEAAAQRAFADRGGQSVFTYLANLLEYAADDPRVRRRPAIPVLDHRGHRHVGRISH